MTREQKDWIHKWLDMADAIIGVGEAGKYELLTAIEVYRRTRQKFAAKVEAALKAAK